MSRQKLYWSSLDSPGVFFLNRSRSGTVSVEVMSETAEPAFIASLNPDQELIAGYFTYIRL